MSMRNAPPRGKAVSATEGIAALGWSCGRDCSPAGSGQSKKIALPTPIRLQCLTLNTEAIIPKR